MLRREYVNYKVRNRLVHAYQAIPYQRCRYSLSYPWWSWCLLLLLHFIAFTSISRWRSRSRVRWIVHLSSIIVILIHSRRQMEKKRGGRIISLVKMRESWMRIYSRKIGVKVHFSCSKLKVNDLINLFHYDNKLIFFLWYFFARWISQIN